MIECTRLIARRRRRRCCCCKEMWEEVETKFDRWIRFLNVNRES